VRIHASVLWRARFPLGMRPFSRDGRRYAKTKQVFIQWGRLCGPGAHLAAPYKWFTTLARRRREAADGGEVEIFVELDANDFAR